MTPERVLLALGLGLRPIADGLVGGEERLEGNQAKRLTGSGFKHYPNVTKSG